MRFLIVSLAVLTLAGCDPIIRKFEVTPAQLQCAGQVSVFWEASDKDGRLETDHPVIPPLPASAPSSGSQLVTVQQTTEFKYYFPGAGHREKVVSVSGEAKATQLNFTGTCDAVNGPAYGPIAVSATKAPGKLTKLTSNADWPVHVFINGQEIALGAGGEPIFPLPDVTAAGTYTITVPGVVGPGVCKEAGAEGGGPVGGGTVPAPPVTISVTGSCG